MLVAFASSDRTHVDQHFGSTAGFVLYAVDARHARLAGVMEFAPQAMDGNEHKLGERIAALQGCAAVYCLAVGGSAVRQLVAAGIQPVRLDAPRGIEALLGELATALRAGSLPWQGPHARRPADPDRFARMAAEGWQE